MYGYEVRSDGILLLETNSYREAVECLKSASGEGYILDAEGYLILDTIDLDMMEY